VITAIPDPMRRFARTPFGQMLRHSEGDLFIETDDSELTRELAARFGASERGELLRAVGYVKVVVENMMADDDDAIVRVDAGKLRVLLRGTATILIHDAETRELLVFLLAGVSCTELFERLIPAVVGGDCVVVGRGGITKA